MDWLWTPLKDENDDLVDCLARCWLYYDEYCPEPRPGIELPEYPDIDQGYTTTGRKKLTVVNRTVSGLCGTLPIQWQCISKPEITVHYPKQGKAYVQRISTFYRYRYDREESAPGKLIWKVYAPCSKETDCELLGRNARPATRIDADTFARLLVFLPADIVKNEPVDVSVIAIDRYGNRCTSFEGNVSFSWEPTQRRVHEMPDEYVFTGGEAYDENKDHGVHVFNGVYCEDEGFLRIVATVNGVSYYSNPCYVHDKEPKYRIYFGDLHFHSNADVDSGGFGDHRGEYVTPDECYRYAAEMMRLDFLALSDHDHAFSDVGDPQGGPGAVQPAWENDKAIWTGRVEPELSSKFPDLVCFYAYEWTNNKNSGGNPSPGHRVVLYKNPDGQCFFSKLKSEEIWEELEDLFGKLDAQEISDVLVIPHVMSSEYRPWISSLEPSDGEKRYQKIGEIYSHKNDGCLRAFEGTETKWSALERHTYRYAWANGYKMGVIGSTDNHLGQPGIGKWTEDIAHAGGLAAVLAKQGNRRDKIWGALQNRRTYATSGEKIYLRFSINDNPMGKKLFGETNLNISVKVAALSNITKVRIYKMLKKDPNDPYEYQCIVKEDDVGWKFTGSYNRTADIPEGVWWMYYVRVETDEGQGAWSSPIWIKG
ncbi:MAG: DUF3604 domain-containing protein [Deltaproteobacteria bacterium]|nr:DUF3604 domain-containing protein [Deltaproteobacteria bacterium]